MLLPFICAHNIQYTPISIYQRSVKTEAVSIALRTHLFQGNIQNNHQSTHFAMLISTENSKNTCLAQHKNTMHLYRLQRMEHTEQEGEGGDDKDRCYCTKIN